MEAKFLNTLQQAETQGTLSQSVQSLTGNDCNSIQPIVRSFYGTMINPDNVKAWRTLFDNGRIVIPYTFDSTYYRTLLRPHESYELWYGSPINYHSSIMLSAHDVRQMSYSLQYSVTNQIANMNRDLSANPRLHIELHQNDSEFLTKGGIVFAACGNNDQSGSNCIIPVTQPLQYHSFVANKTVPVVRICFPEQGGCYYNNGITYYPLNPIVTEYNIVHETSHAIGMQHYDPYVANQFSALLGVSIMGKKGNVRTNIGALDKLLLHMAYNCSTTLKPIGLCADVSQDLCAANYPLYGITTITSSQLSSQVRVKEPNQVSAALPRSGTSWFSWIIPSTLLSVVGTAFNRIKSKLWSRQEPSCATTSSHSYHNSKAKKRDVRTSAPQLDLDSQIMFFSVVVHMLRKLSPFTLPWNKKHVLTFAEETSLHDILNNTQIVMKQIHKLQKTPAIQEVFLADKFAYICRELDSENALSVIAEINKILRKASEKRIVTRSQIESWENRLTKIQTYLRQIEDFNNQFANLTQETKHLAARYPNNHITVKRSYDYINNRLKQAFSMESKTANVFDEKCEQKARQHSLDENLTQNMEHNLRHVVPNLHSTHEGRPLIADHHTDTTSSPIEAKGITLH